MAFTSGQILTAAQLNTFDPGTKITNAGGTAGAPSYTFNGDVDTGMFRSAADSVSFATAGTARLTIDSAGEVGIGTTSPGEPLHIVTASGDAFLKQENGTTTTFSGPDSSNTGLYGTSSNHDVRFITNNSERLRIDTSGDASMAGHLTAQSGGADGGIVLGQAFQAAYVGLRTAGMGEASEDEYVIMSNGNHTFISGGSSGDVYIRGGGNDTSCQIFLDTSEDKIGFTGAVGIGTNSPAGNFQVETQGRAFTIIDSGVSNHAEAAFTTLGGDSPAFSILSGYDLDLHTGTTRGGLTSRLHIDSGGAITLKGIVTTTDEIRVGSGTAVDPAYTFDADNNTGFFVTGNDGVTRWSGNGGEGGYLYSGGIRTVDGSAAAPAYAFTSDSNTGMYRSAADQISFALGGTVTFQILTNGVFVPSGSNYFGVPTTGTGNDAEWSSTGFGTFLLKRNSSLTAEKENITADLGEHLTADMIDQVVPKLWNRLNSPGYPEIGPLAEDMDAISPFLAAKGANIESGEYEEFLTGINKTAYLSLLVLAVKDLRARVATLEAA